MPRLSPRTRQRPTGAGLRSGFPTVDDERGVSALEFALLAPFLILLFVLMIDTGLALNQRAAIGHVLRIGAHTAMGDPGASDVLQAMEQAGDDNLGAAAGDLIIAAPMRYCVCPENPDVDPAEAPPCDTICADDRATNVNYALAASLPYRSFFLRERVVVTLGSSLTVQVR